MSSSSRGENIYEHRDSAHHGSLIRYRRSTGGAPRQGWLQGLRPAGMVSGGQRPFQMLPLDVTSDDSVETAVREVMRLDGRIDLLVNNAGFSIAPARAEGARRSDGLDRGEIERETSLPGDRCRCGHWRNCRPTLRPGGLSRLSVPSQ